MDQWTSFSPDPCSIPCSLSCPLRCIAAAQALRDAMLKEDGAQVGARLLVRASHAHYG